MRISKRLPDYVVALAVVLCFAVAAWPGRQDEGAAPTLRLVPSKAARSAARPSAASRSHAQVLRAGRSLRVPRHDQRRQATEHELIRRQQEAARDGNTLALRAARQEALGFEASQRAARSQAAARQQEAADPGDGSLPPLAPDDPRR